MAISKWVNSPPTMGDQNEEPNLNGCQSSKLRTESKHNSENHKSFFIEEENKTKVLSEPIGDTTKGPTEQENLQPPGELNELNLTIQQNRPPSGCSMSDSKAKSQKRASDFQLIKHVDSRSFPLNSVSQSLSPIVKVG